MTATEKRRLTRDYGKVLETFTCEVEGTQYKCELRMRKGDSKAYMFSAVYPYDNEDTGRAVNLHARDSDPAEAREKLEAKLNQHFVVVWEQFIHIVVGGSNVGGMMSPDASGSLAISLEKVDVGTRRDGSKCYKDCGFIRDNLPQTGSSSFTRYGSARSYGLIPYTDQAWETLEKIIEGLKELRGRVEDFLTGKESDKIIAQLASVGKLLPEPKEKQDDD